MDNKGSGSGAGKVGGGAAGVAGSAKNSITPGFLGGAGGGDKPVGLSEKNAKGAALLGAAENAASDELSEQSEDSLDGARDDEENVNYTGSGVSGDDDLEKKGFFSNGKGPIGTILGLILGFAALIGGAQLSQPFSLVEQFRTSFNSMQTSVSHRSNVLFRYQLGRDVRNPLRSKLFGPDVFKISAKQETKLKSRGIELEDVDVDGKTRQVMKFTDGSGSVKYIVPDASLESGVKARFGTDAVMDFNTAFRTDSDFFEAYKGGSLTWRGSIANWFESLTTKFLNDNKLTRNLFASFDQAKAESSGNARADVSELIAKGTDEISDGGGKRTTGKTANADDNDTNTRTVISDDGSQVRVKDEFSSDSIPRSSISRSNLGTEAGVRATLESNVEPKVKADADSGGGVTGAVQMGTSVVCTVADTIGAISLLVTGAEALQIIHLITGYLEAIDKVKAGNGDTSPINELSSALNEKTTNVHVDFADVSVSAVDADITSSNSSQNDVINAIDTMKTNASSLQNVKKTSTNKTAMEASGIAALFGGGKVNPYDESVKSFNFSGSIKRILGGIGVSTFSFTTCSIAKMVANAAGVVEGAWNIGSCIVGLIGSVVTYGATSTFCAGLVGQVISGIAFSAAIGGLISILISSLVPFVSGILTRDLISQLGGEDLGNALVSGANMYMGNNHRYNGGSLSNASTYTQFALAQQEVIAEDARYERARRSPFDASSQYTFLGTIIRQMMGFVGSSSIMSTVMSTNDVVGNSIVAMMPTASAVTVANSLVDNYEDVCPYLSSIGAVGDAYCNPYAVTDMSTIGMDPSEVMAVISDNLEIVEEDNSIIGCIENSGDSQTECPSGFAQNSDTSGGIKIKRNSDLAKYILYCDQRASAFGIADSNIANEIGDWANVPLNGTIGAVVNGGIGAIPAFGDLVDVVQNAEKLANYGYIFGESCVAGNNVEANTEYGDFSEDSVGASPSTVEVESVSPNWETAKYYQRFIEDQSLMESMGVIEKSAVTAFIDDYRVDHPLDNSYEGILARYSGMTKETVVATLEKIDYLNYLANYDPTTRFAFGQEVKPAEANELKFDNDNKVAYYVLLGDVEFADVRNRTFAS